MSGAVHIGQSLSEISHHETESVIDEDHQFRQLTMATWSTALPDFDLSSYHKHLLYQAFNGMRITAAARSKTWIVFASSNAGIVGSNPTQGMDVCVRLFCVCVVPCVDSGLATDWSPVQGVLPTVYSIKTLKKRPRSNKGLYSHR
jgi:hypothetical protein